MSEPAVRIRGLAARYGAVQALADLDLEIPRGRITAILGRNGAGKTTLVETIAGLRPVQAGTVEVLDRPVSDRRTLATQVGVMLQSGGVPTSARGVAFLRHLSRMYPRPAELDELVTALDLDTRPTAFRRLSGGQQQRVRLACALIGRPQLALLDEPAAGLDPDIRVRVWDFLRGLKAAGTTIVLSTHSFEEAEAIGDNIVVLGSGRLRTAGALNDLRGEPVLRFSTRSEILVPDLEAAFPSLTVSTLGGGVHLLRGAVTAETVASVAAWAAGRGIVLDDLGLVRATVRELYERAYEDQP